MHVPAFAPLLLAIALVACSSTPRRPTTPPQTTAPAGAGPHAAAPPAEAMPSSVPAASPVGAGSPTASLPPEPIPQPEPEPRVEPVREGGPNKPYQVQGQTFRPERGDPAMAERGIASWYGRPFHGRRTASGEVYDMHAFTAAHKTMPIPSYARVVNPANGREIIVRINDRGPFIAGRIIDLSYAAAVKLGTSGGVAPVEVHRITHEAIRSGAWRRGGPELVAVAATAAEAAPAPPAARAELPAPPNPAPTTLQPAYTEPARGFWLQLGAFAQAPGAQDFRRKVEAQVAWLVPLMAVFDDRGLHRLQAGPYASRGEAQAAQERLRAELQLVALVVQRR